MAAERAVRTVPAEVRLPVRQAESIVDAIGVLGSRRRELRAAVGQRLERLDARADASEMQHTALEQRLADVEALLGRLRQRVHTRRGGERGERVAVLERQIELLRGSTNGHHALPRARALAAASRGVSSAEFAQAESQPAHPAPHQRGRLSTDQLGLALMFVGYLVLLWVGLWQLGLALGLS